MPNASEAVVQRLVRAFARATLPRTEPQPIAVAALRRVLVVRPDDRVGDVLLTTPLLRALREGLPHVRIDVLLAARRQVLIDGLFLADRFVPYDKRRAARNPFSFAALMRRLRQEDYDLAIDATHAVSFSLTAAVLTRATNAPARIGHDRGDAARFYTHPVQVPPELRHDVAAKLKLLEPLGLKPRGLELETSAGLLPDAVSRVEELLAEARLERGRYIVVNPGARKADRRVAPETLARIVQRLRAATGLKALIVWGPGEEELAQAVWRVAGDSAVLAPPTDLHELAALLRRSALAITADTGPMHLAVACQVPVLALFTQGDSARWGHPLPTFHAIEQADGRADLEDEVEAQALRLLDGAGVRRT